MRQVNGLLYIANEFPPLGGSGIQRSLKFVKYLSALGEKVTVISKDDQDSLQDPTMTAEIPKNVKVYRLKPCSIINKKGLLKYPYKLLSKIISPDYEHFWQKKNMDTVRNIVKKENIGTVISSSFPYSSHIMAMELKKSFPELIWIADFRDEWTNNPYHLDSFFNRIKLKSEKRMELAVTSSCDFLIANTPIMLQNFIADMPSLAGRSTFLPNGYDEADFEGIHRPLQKNIKFTITYSGSLYGRRNLDDFFEALKLLAGQNKINLDDIRLNIIGNIYPSAIEAYENNYGLKGRIHFKGYLPHKKAIEELASSDMLVLVIGAGKGSKNFYTGKVFEYMRSFTPILAIVPEDGVAAGVIEETNTGKVINPGDTERIAQAISDIYTDFKLDHKPKADMGALEKYSRLNQAKKLQSIIKELDERRKNEKNTF